MRLGQAYALRLLSYVGSAISQAVVVKKSSYLPLEHDDRILTAINLFLPLCNFCVFISYQRLYCSVLSATTPGYLTVL